MVKPYIEKKYENFIIRTLDENTPNDELVWHRDKSNRIVIPISGEGWKFQFDNNLPEPIEKLKEIIILKNIYHRVIKGITPLILFIHESNDIPSIAKIKEIKKGALNEINSII